MSAKIKFEKTVQKAVGDFEQSVLLKRLRSKDYTLADYHNCLLAIFQQAYNSSNSFSLAAAMCDLRHQKIRDYLIHHAEEEKDHWQWIVGDLNNSGYKGPNPFHIFPSADTEAYIAYNYYIAQRFSYARLGIASVLEGIGGKYGRLITTSICNHLNLKENQVVFSSGHSETDVEHSKDIFKVLDESNLQDHEWNILTNAAEKAGVLYPRIFESAFAKQ